MADYSIVVGEITISPPIDQAKITENWNFTTIDFISSTNNEETADRIVPVFDDQYRADDIESELNQFIDNYGNDHQLVGFLEEQHENREVNYGWWRWYVQKNKVTKVLPSIVWNEPLIQL